MIRFDLGDARELFPKVDQYMGSALGQSDCVDVGQHRSHPIQVLGEGPIADSLSRLSDEWRNPPHEFVVS